MKKPDQAISIIKDFCPGSGIEVEGYINYLENRLAKIEEICNKRFVPGLINGVILAEIKALAKGE
jgi:hypothetical protein